MKAVSVRKAARRVRRSRTLLFAALLPALVGGLEAFLALMPELRESFGAGAYVALSVVVSTVIAYLRATTDRPLSAYDDYEPHYDDYRGH